MADSKKDTEEVRLTPETITRETILRIMESNVLYPQQFRVKESLEEDIHGFAQKDELRKKVDEMVEEMNHTADLNLKKLDGLRVAKSVAPRAWGLMYGDASPEEIMKKEFRPGVKQETPPENKPQ